MTCKIKENSKEIELIIYILYEDWLTLVIFNFLLFLVGSFVAI